MEDGPGRVIGASRGQEQTSRLFPPSMSLPADDRFGYWYTPKQVLPRVATYSNDLVKDAEYSASYFCWHADGN